MDVNEALGFLGIVLLRKNHVTNGTRRPVMCQADLAGRSISFVLRLNYVKFPSFGYLIAGIVDRPRFHGFRVPGQRNDDYYWEKWPCPRLFLLTRKMREV